MRCTWCTVHLADEVITIPEGSNVLYPLCIECVDTAVAVIGRDKGKRVIELAESIRRE